MLIEKLKIKRKTKNIIKKGIIALCTLAVLAGVMPVVTNENIAAATNRGYKILVKPQLEYDYIYGFYDGESVVRDKDGKYGVIDLKGKEVVKCEYDYIEVSDDGDYFYIYDKKEDYAGLMDKKGNVIIPFSNHYKQISVSYGDSIKTTTSNKVIFQKLNSNTITKVLEIDSEQEADYISENAIKVRDTSRRRYSVYKIEGETTRRVFDDCQSVEVLGVSQKYYYLVDNKYIVNRDCEVVQEVDGYVGYAGNNYLYIADDHDKKIRLFNMIKNTMVDVEIPDEWGYPRFTEFGDVGFYIGHAKDNIFLFGTISGMAVESGAGNSDVLINDEGKIISKIFSGQLSLWAYEKIMTAPYDWYGVYNYEGKYIGALGCDVDDAIVVPESNFIVVNRKGKIEVYDNNLYEIKALSKYTELLLVNKMLVGYDEDKNDVYMDYNGKKLLTITSGNGYSNNINYAKYNSQEVRKCKNCNGEFREGVIPVEFGDKWGIYQITSKDAYISRKPTVSIAKAQIKKIKAGKKKVKLTIKKINNVKGYLIQYGTNSKFKKYRKKFVNKTTVTIKKLKSKKKYYFRVKGYITYGNEKYYSKKWSKVKKVKVK